MNVFWGILKFDDPFLQQVLSQSEKSSVAQNIPLCSKKEDRPEPIRRWMQGQNSRFRNENVSTNE
jgi:hypothetical protein